MDQANVRMDRWKIGIDYIFCKTNVKKKYSSSNIECLHIQNNGFNRKVLRKKCSSSKKK